MTARTRSTLGPSGGRRRGAQSDDRPGRENGGKTGDKAGKADKADPGKNTTVVGRLGWGAVPWRLWLALVVSVAGAVVTFMGVRQGVVLDSPPSAYKAAPLLLVIAVAPAAFAILAITLGRAPAAAGVLAGAALLTPGLALVDAQFIHDPLTASRPEIMVPTSLAPLTVASGAYLLIVGHVLAAVAGLLALGRAGAGPDSDYYAGLDASRSTKGRAVGWALTAGAVTALGLLFPPFQSDNAFIVAQDLIASPSLVKFGGLLIIITVLVGCIAAAVNPRPTVARGLAAGMFLGLCWLVLPQLAGIARVEWLHAEPWPFFALVPVGLLAIVLLVTGERSDEKEDVSLEGSPVLTGALGIVTGVLALIGGFGTLVVARYDQPPSYANRQLIPAGIVIILIGVLLCTKWAARSRPAFVVALAAIPLVGLAALDTAFTATTVSNVIPGFPVATSDTRVGAAVWFIIAAMVLALVAAVVGAVMGGDEDADETKRTLHVRYAIPAAGAVLFALGAFTSPMIKAAGFTPAGLFTEFRLASWGLLIALLVVLGATVLAAFSRPVPAAALLLGAAVVVGVHVLEYPLTNGRVDDATVGGGTWLSLACLVALVAAAVAAMTDPNRDAVE